MWENVFRLLAGVAFLAILNPGVYTGEAQELPKELQIKPKHEVTVAVKLVQVYVTDKDGNPAGGLTANDFEIYDNNKIVPLIHFEKHFIEEGADTSVADSPALNRKFILLFDLAFTDARGLLKAKEAALSFMESSLLPTDEISLLTYTANRGLTLHEYLSRDHDRIRDLINSFGLKNITGRAENLSSFLYSDALMSFQINQVEALPEESFFTDQARLQTGQMLDVTRRQGYVGQARFYLLALNNMAKALRTIPGFKNVIFFSAGLARQLLFGRTGGAFVGDWQTPEQLASQLAEYDAAQFDLGLQNDFTKMLKEFKNSNCAVYAVDISRPNKGLDVESPGGVLSGRRELDGADSLKQFASQTGGRFFANTVKPENSMEEIHNTTRNYYVLGFKVDEKWDGKFHKIKVKIKKKGYKVYSQGGYFNPRPFKEYNSFEKLLHLIKIALTEDPWPYIPVEIPVDSQTLIENDQPMVLAYTRVSGSQMEEILGPKTEAYLLFFDEQGDLVNIQKFKVTVTEKDKKENDDFLASFLLQVKPGRYECALIIRNLDNGHSARGRAPVVVFEEPPAMPFIDNLLWLRLDDRAKELTASVEPTLASLYGYNPGTYSAVINEVPVETRSLFAALRLACPLNDEEGLKVSAALIDEGRNQSKNLPVYILNKNRQGLIVKLLLELRLDELASGDYDIRFSVSGANLAKPLEIETVFRIR